MASDVPVAGEELSRFTGHPVELESFQGPLDLLLHLIRKDRIEIWQISVSRITRQYLDYLSTLRSLNIEVAGEFLVMAATLMRIKSQNLLPRPSFLAESQEGEEPITREGLIARLLEYRKYREAARSMAGLEWEQARRHPRGNVVSLDAGHAIPLREPRLTDLTTYLQDMLARREPEESHQVILEEVRLEDQIEYLEELLRRRESTEPLPGGAGRGWRFDRLLRRPGLRLEVVVTFLAVLELARLQRLEVWQRQALEEIWLLAREAEAGVPENPTGEEMT